MRIIWKNICLYNADTGWAEELEGNFIISNFIDSKGENMKPIMEMEQCGCSGANQFTTRIEKPDEICTTCLDVDNLPTYK